MRASPRWSQTFPDFFTKTNLFAILLISLTHIPIQDVWMAGQPHELLTLLSVFMSLSHFIVTQEFVIQFMDLYNCAKQSGRFAWNYVIASCTLQYYDSPSTWFNDVRILALQTPVHPVATLGCLLLHRDIFYYLKVDLDLSRSLSRSWYFYGPLCLVHHKLLALYVSCSMHLAVLACYWDLSHIATLHPAPYLILHCHFQGVQARFGLETTRQEAVVRKPNHLKALITWEENYTLSKSNEQQ